MIAKLVAHGPTRDAACLALRDGLGQLRLAGLTTNRNFLRALLSHSDFLSANHDTQFIDGALADLVVDPSPGATVVALAAAAALGPLPDHAGFSVGSALSHTVNLRHGGQDLAVIAKIQGHRVVMECDGVVVELRSEQGQICAPTAPQITAHKHANTVTVFDGNAFVFTLPDPLSRTGAVRQDRHILAPMPGMVQAVHAQMGDTVKAGDPLVTLEAMKMQHVLKAAQDCLVETVHAAAGQQVQAQVVLMDVCPSESPKTG